MKYIFSNFTGYLYDKYRTYDVVFKFAASVFLTDAIMFLITYILRFCRERRQLPDHVSRLQAAGSCDEPFEEIADPEAVQANNAREKQRKPSSPDNSCAPPAPNVAP